MKTRLIVLILATLATLAKSETTLTIYNDNLGVVKEVRLIDFATGINTVKFTDVAETIDPTSVSFKTLDDIAISLLEQNYEYDLVNPYGLIEKYIDKDIMLYVQTDENDSPILDTYRLYSFSGNDFVVMKGGELYVFNKSVIKGVKFPKQEKELLTKPTLIWLAKSPKKASVPCQVAYMANGISWKANYSMIINDTENAMGLSGWVTITNNTGKDYQDAQIKLIAGDVRIEQNNNRGQNIRAKTMYFAMAEDSSAGFEEKAFQDFHLYTLGRPSTINNKQVKQIQFIDPVENVKLNKYYKVKTDIAGQSLIEIKPDICLEFQNKKACGLGMPLPKGLIRVFKEDKADGSLEFVGESPIDHTPKDEKIEVVTGQAFDIKTELKTLDVANKSRVISVYKKEAVIKNHKDEDATVKIDYRYSTYENCEISNSNFEYTMPLAGIVRFEIPVKADGEISLKFDATITRRN